MKLTVFAVSILLATSLAGAQDAPLTKDQKIERILELSNSQAALSQYFDQVKSSLMPKIPANATSDQIARLEVVQQKVLALLKSQLTWDEVRPGFVKIYSNTFSEDEITGLLAFYESPTGKAFTAKMPSLLPQFLQLGQSVAAKLMPEIQRIQRESQGGNNGK